MKKKDSWATDNGPELMEHLRYARDNVKFPEPGEGEGMTLYNLIDFAIDYIEEAEDKKKSILFALAESLGSPFDELYKQQQERKKDNV